MDKKLVNALFSVIIITNERYNFRVAISFEKLIKVSGSYSPYTTVAGNCRVITSNCRVIESPIVAAVPYFANNVE